MLITCGILAILIVITCVSIINLYVYVRPHVSLPVNISLPVIVYQDGAI